MIKKLTKTFFVKKSDHMLIQIFRYCIVGGLASIFQIGIFNILTNIFDVHYIVSNTIGFIVGILVNFLLSRKWVFNDNKKIISTSFIIFTIIGVIGVLLSNFILYILIDMEILTKILKALDLKLIKSIAQLIAIFIVLFWNFGARKILVFKTN